MITTAQRRLGGAWYLTEATNITQLVDIDNKAGT